jgi:acyl carrier protein
LANIQTAVDPEKVIVASIEELLARRGATGIVVGPESNLLTDLAMDSLELAELSATLIDEVGHDPFSEGIFPETIAELVAFYNL